MKIDITSFSPPFLFLSLPLFFLRPETPGARFPQPPAPHAFDRVAQGLPNQYAGQSISISRRAEQMGDELRLACIMKIENWKSSALFVQGLSKFVSSRSYFLFLLLYLPDEGSNPVGVTDQPTDYEVSFDTAKCYLNVRKVKPRTFYSRTQHRSCLMNITDYNTTREM